MYIGPMAEKVCAHVHVHGRVQGVFFRAETMQTAQQYGVTGWVRNCADASVEACFEGERAAVEAVIAWCRQGPPAARVDQVEVSWREPENFTGFQITY